MQTKRELHELARTTALIMLPGNPFLAPGTVESRDISYAEPVVCPLCLGVGKIDATPCCGSPYVENQRGYHCFRCHKQYLWNRCPDCDGEGTV